MWKNIEINVEYSGGVTLPNVVRINLYHYVPAMQIYFHEIKLEQLDRLRSEDTPAASWLPIPLSHIGSQVKGRQSQSYKFKYFAKILKLLNFETTMTRDTPSEVAR